jgi:FKBP-type peptidyl-prolyl cis-trans isomerase FkpA
MVSMRAGFRWTAAAVSLVLLTSAGFAAEVSLQTDDQKTLYALGVAIASRIPPFNPTPEEIALIEAGMSDGLSGATPRIDMATWVAKIEPFLQAHVEAAAKTEEAAGDKYRAEAAKQPGAVTTDSGMIFFEVTPGDGPQPTDSDSVQIHIKGTLANGKVFDSSIDRGEPETLAVNSLPCFSEGLKRMKVGEKAKLICPPDLAYGNRGKPPWIPPGATVTFEVQLLGIVAKPAAPAGG